MLFSSCNFEGILVFEVFFISCSFGIVTIDFVQFLFFVVSRFLSIVLPCQLKLNEPVIVYVEHSEERPSGSLSFIFKWLLCSTSIHLHSLYALQIFVSFLQSFLFLLLLCIKVSFLACTEKLQEGI